MNLVLATAQAQETYLFDQTPPSEDGTAFYLVFTAYGESATGHADVSWGKEAPNLQASISEACVGFFSDQTWLQFTFASVTGYLRECSATSPGFARRLIARVTQQNYQRSLSVLSQWRRRVDTAATRYRLFYSDCITFVSDIAHAANLVVPDRTLIPPNNVFPEDFLQSLAAANHARSAGAH